MKTSLKLDALLVSKLRAMLDVIEDPRSTSEVIEEFLSAVIADETQSGTLTAAVHEIPDWLNDPKWTARRIELQAIADA